MSLCGGRHLKKWKDIILDQRKSRMWRKRERYGKINREREKRISIRVLKWEINHRWVVSVRALDREQSFRGHLKINSNISHHKFHLCFILSLYSKQLLVFMFISWSIGRWKIWMLSFESQLILVNFIISPKLRTDNFLSNTVFFRVCLRVYSQVSLAVQMLAAVSGRQVKWD